MKTFRDAVHGDISFNDTELEFIDTATMQRLRGIKQLGTSNLVFPTAVHSRFEHSLGTCWLTDRLLEVLSANGTVITAQERQDTKLAALLHDITHIPFGHTLEDERRVLPRHDVHQSRFRTIFTESEIGAKLRRQKRFKAVAGLLRGKEYNALPRPFLGQIISYTICSDLLDYLRRDAFFCGLALNYDNRIFSYFRVDQEQLVLSLVKDQVFRHDALSELINILRLRYSLTERVYYHHAKVATGVMLSRIVELALNAGLKPTDLFTATDYGLLFLLRERYGQIAPIGELLDKFESRYLCKRCYALTYQLVEHERKALSRRFHFNQHGERQAAEARIAQALEIPPEAISIYCPPIEMYLKEATVLVKVDAGPPRHLSSLQNSEIQALQDRYCMLWKFYVFIDREYDHKLTQAGEVSEQILGYPNQISVEKRGQLSLFDQANDLEA